MMEKESYCNACEQKLRARESDASILLVCINPRCDNYWVKKDSEIVMLLK